MHYQIHSINSQYSSKYLSLPSKLKVPSQTLIPCCCSATGAMIACALYFALFSSTNVESFNTREIYNRLVLITHTEKKILVYVRKILNLICMIAQYQ